MREFFIFQLLVFSALTKQSLFVFANAWTFFKRGVSLPGPTMSFNKSLNYGIFEFEFKTFVDRALILYQDNEGEWGPWGYFRLTIEQGRLHFAADKLSVSTERQYNDFKWHTVRIERNTARFKLLLDGEVKANLTADLTGFSSNLQLGGFPNSRANQRSSLTDTIALNFYLLPLNRRGFFFGCVRNIRYGQNEATMTSAEDIPSLRSHVRKGSCNLSLCDKRPEICKNQGVCVPSGENSATCDCTRTGYSGATCTEDGLRLILNGAYKVAYKLRTRVTVEQEQFTLQIRAARKNAIVFLAKAARENLDKLRLEIKHSRIIVTSNGKDKVTLNSSEFISDNEWHLVSYKRNGTLHLLTVDGKTVNFTSTELDTNRSYDILYIGENKTLMNGTIEMHDFIWEYRNKEINLVKGVFESLGSSNNEYMVIPKGVIPIFNLEPPIKDIVMNDSLTTVASTVIDGCKKNNKECHLNAYCSNTNESYQCDCKTGYTGDGIRSCTDIDECQASPCHEHAQCTNTNGSYTCTCRQGFHGDGHLNCSDVDECSKSPSLCFGRCTNTFGSYSCHCIKGFTGDGQSCTDMDECVLSKDACGEHALCSNTEGSFVCKCDRGYIENKDGNCTDTDECSSGKAICHALATCVNTKGSFMCRCPEKYHGDGVSTCLRNNPCDAVPCFLGLTCTKINDSYTCEKCPPFFDGDGINCVRNNSKKIVNRKGKLVLTNEQWTDELTRKSSEVYKTLASQLVKKIRKVYKEHPEFVYAFINKFRKGSVVAEFSLLFTTDVEEPFKTLEEAISDGHLTNMTVETGKLAAKSSSKKTTIHGLQRTIFICVVAFAAGICILGVSVIIFLVISRRRQRRRAQIYKEKPEESLHATEPQGLLFKSGDGANCVDEAHGPNESKSLFTQF